MTSMRRRYVASTSERRHVPAGNLVSPWPPNILNLAPPPPHNILNLPTPMPTSTNNVLGSSRKYSHKIYQKLSLHKIAQTMAIFYKWSHHFTNCIKIYWLCPQFPTLQLYSKDALLRDDLSSFFQKLNLYIKLNILMLSLLSNTHEETGCNPQHFISSSRKK